MHLLGGFREPLSACACALAATLVCLSGAASAAQPRTSPTAPSPQLADNPRWTDLSPAQKGSLAPLEKDWSSIDADQKQKWIEVSRHFHKMSPAERQRVQARMAEWAKLSPKERGEARLHYQELSQMTPEERAARWQQYQALTPEQRRRLAERAKPASGGAAPKPVHGSSANGVTPKSNLVSVAPPQSAGVRSVGPTVVQAKPGATTTLITRRPNPPAHQQPGLPKVAATPGFVDRTTLLPQRGAQGAGTRQPLAPVSSPNHRRAATAAPASGPASAPAARQ